MSADKNFLIIDGVLVKDMESGSLRVYESDGDVFIRMVSKRLVCEESWKWWVIEADFSDIDTELLEQLFEVLASKKDHLITFLPSNGKAEIITSEFYLTSRPAPALKSWQDELPEWENVSYVFEEVRPHD